MPFAKHLQTVVRRLFDRTEGQTALATYVILDAARHESIYKKMLEAGHGDGCLYRGDKAKALAEVAPYLVLLKREEAFTEWVINTGWGNSWGIFLESGASPVELKRHFGKFIIVSTEKGESFYFRFYDPRVLRVYLPSCNRKELKTVFGPVQSYFMENQDGSFLEFTHSKEFKLVRNIGGIPG